MCNIIIVIAILIIVTDFQPKRCFTLWLSLCNDVVLDACEFIQNGTRVTSPRCQNNGRCVNGLISPGRFDCDCVPGFAGTYCEQSSTADLSLCLSLSVQCYAWTEYKFTYVCVCLCVCPSHFLSTRLQVRLLDRFLQLIA